MKTTLAAISLIGLATATLTTSYTNEGLNREVTKNEFGAVEMTDWHANGMDKTVYLPSKAFQKDYERKTLAIQHAKNQHKTNLDKMQSDRIYKCDNRGPTDEQLSPDDAGYFFPINVGIVNSNNPSISFTDGMCFQSIKFTYSQTGDDNDIGDVTVTVDTEKAISLFCKDWFFFATTELYHVETFRSRGKHTITFKNISPDAKLDIMRNGVRIFMFCDGYIDTFKSVFNFALQFLGGFGINPDIPVFGSHIPEYMEKANIDFLSTVMGYTLEKRTITDYDYDENLIQSGDFLSIMRLDGVDPIIMYGSGSHAGHSTMALRYDGELYIIES